MKICTLCKIEKSLEEYNKHSKRPDGKQSVCKDCNRARSKKYYKDNPEKHRAKVLERTRDQVKLLRDYVNAEKSKPCVDCGNNYIPFAMDFDHVIGVKRSEVSKLVRSGSALQTVIDEIAKCELVCATCHRIRTWNRLREGSTPS